MEIFSGIINKNKNTFRISLLLFLFLVVFLVFLVFILINVFKRFQIQSKQNIFDKIFVINLRNTNEGERRWKVIKNHPVFKNQLTRTSAVNGYTYDFTKEFDEGIVRPTWNFGRWKYQNVDHIISIKPGELGVSLSHYRLWQKIAKMPDTSRVLILEDDAIVVAPNFYEKVRFYMTQLPDDWDVFLLNFWLHRGDDGRKVNAHISQVKSFVLLSAYAIRPQGARRLLECTPIDKPLDTWMSFQSDKVFIYRHHDTFRNITTHQQRARYPRSALIRAKSKKSQIEHTNNW